MKYSIVTIDDSRAKYKDYIRRVVPYPETCFGGVNAKAVNLREELEKRNLHMPYPGQFKIGEIGIWLSLYDRWKWVVDNDEPLIVFEDDAIPNPDFERVLERDYEHLPEDAAFMALWIPPNQLQDYRYNAVYNEEGIVRINGYRPDGESQYDFGDEYLSRVYNGYGHVGILYTPAGGKFFKERAEEVGLYTTADCFLYQEAHAGRCQGYGPKPKYANLVHYDWPQTTIQDTERYNPYL